MNYAGKFDAKLSADESGLHSNGHVHVETVHAAHVPPDAIIVPDAQLLFNGDFKRSGVDLILSRDHQELVLHDYFKGEKRAALSSPDGAHLTGDIVNALAGNVQYAQADGSAAAGHIIGHVTKLVGTATAVRNGVSVILNNGDNVEKGDVVQSGSDSTLGITFIDGTVFGLSSNARMVLNEMVYDPNGSNNSSLLSLVAGTITFVAGETAKHGDMKIDTPVATMGIRGTAVLFAVHFKLPNGVLLPDGEDPPPDAVPEGQFQVLVEPDGTSGSYILFEKTTLTPYVVVDKPGLQINITSGNVTQTLTQLSPEVQKLITDVFTLKFSDSSNTKTLDHFTDSIIPQTFAPTMLAFGPPVTPTGPVVNTSTGSSPNAGPSSPDIGHIGGAPKVTLVPATGFKVSELTGKTGDTADFDTVSGKINFVDVNLGDRPTVSSKFESFAYTDAHGNVVPLNAQQVADVTALELNLTLKPDSGNLNTGSVLWTYNDPTNPLSIPDKAFDFLAAGEKLQLTYWLTVDNNFAPADQTTTVPITITITGTNDVPVIATGAQTIKFAAGTSTTGGDLIPGSSTSGVLVNKSTSPGGTPTATETGTFTFTDPDLTDTHSIVLTSPTGDLTGASLSGTTLDLTALESKYPGPFQIFETALSASLATDSTGTGTGTINWTLAELPVYVADFIPSGETLALTYTIEVKDSQGAISTQTITVNITGTDNPAEVWIATVPQGATPGGLWSKASNWETGNVPTATDDVIIITNQLLGLTPSYPATIDAATNAVAKTVTLNDFSDLGNAHPELIVQGTLTIGGTFDVGADSTVENSGTITVGGPMEISNTSVLQNDGQLTLQDGGGFKDQTSITNSGTIELSGGTLDVEVAVANAGGKIKVDGPATLKLNGATINGGTITDNGTIDVTADSSINGTTAGSPPVTTYALLNNGAVTVESGVTLTLDNVTVTGTTFTDLATSSTIKVDSGDTLKLNGATINGGTITDNGTIDVTADSSINGTTAGAPPVTTNALLNNGAVTVESGVTLTLDNVTVTGTTFTDTSSGAILSVDATDTLTLSGVTIHGGTINDGTGNTLATGGTIEISGSSTISSANLNHGGVTVDANQTLTLDNDTVTGTTFTDTASGATLSVDATDTLTLSGVTIDGGTINDGTGTTPATGGTIEISGSSTISGASLSHGRVTVDGNQTLTLDNDTVTGATFTDTSSGAILSVDATDTLTLSGVTIHGGTINDGTGNTLATAGTIEISGSSTISSANLNHGGVTVDANQTLTLDNDTVTGTTFTDTASGATLSVDATDTLTLSGVTIDGGTINDGTGTTPATGGTIEISGSSTISGASLNHGRVTVDGNQTLTLDNDTVTGATFTDTASGAILSVDATDTLTLSGVTIDGGTINDGTGTTLATAGTIEISGSSTISGASLNHGGVTVDANQTLTLDNDTVTGTTFTDTASGATLSVDATDTLTLSGVTIDGGTINDGTGTTPATGGTIEISSSSTISGASLNNGAVTIESGVTLALDNVTVNGTVFNDLVTGGTIQIDSGDTLAFNGATINGGTLDVVGVMDSTGISLISGATIINVANIVVVSGTLTIDPTPVTNSGTMEVKGDGTLVLSGETITNGVNGKIQVDADSTHTGTLDLEGSTISGGTLKIFGELDSTGDSFITGVTITNTGTIDVTGGTLIIDATSTLDNTGGTLETNGGNLIIDAAISGNLEIKGGAVLELGASSSTAYSQATVTFEPEATGTLKLDHSETFNGKVAGLDDNTIDLVDIPSVKDGKTVLPTITYSGDKTGGTLTIVSNVDPTQVAHIQLTGDYTGVTWVATNDGNGGTSVTEAPGAIAGLTDGNAVEGTTVSIAITDGGQSVTPVSYQWQIDGKDILNATSATYLPTENDEGHALTVKITYIDALDDTESKIVSAGTVAEKPGENATISLAGLDVHQNAVEGQKITATVTETDINSNTVFTYTWTVGGQTVQGVTGNAYTPTEADEGKTISVAVSFTDTHGNAEAGTTSAGTVQESPTENASISLTGLTGGNAVQGTQVTASVSEADAPASGIIYTWTVGGATVKTGTDAAGATYTPTEADEGKTISVAVSFTDTHGFAEQGTASAGKVQETAASDLVATLNHPTAQQGVAITVTNVQDGGITVTTGLTYAWQDSSDNGLTWVTVGTHSSYTPGESDEGKLMQLVVTYADATGSESSTYSLGMPNDLSATLDSTTAQQGLAIHVTGVNDGGTNVSSGVSYAWQVSSDNGLHWTTVGTNSSFTPIAADAGETLQVVVTYADSSEHESVTTSFGAVAPAKEWSGANSDWQADAQWTLSGAPTANDNALVDVSGTYTLKIDQAAAAHSLVVNDSGATVEILGGDTLTLEGNVTIEAGKLQIESGGTLKDIATSATIAGSFTDNGTIEAAGGKLEIASAVSSGTGTFKIDAGATLQFDHADARNVAFAGSGELILKDPTHFTGTISDSGGSMTSADIVDVAGFDASATVSYSGTTSSGTVTISEAGHTVHLKVGANSGNWSAPVTDGNGGILIHDPPASTSDALGGVVMQDPGPVASSTIVASAPNQTLSGLAASDTFVFNFAAIGQDTVTNFHPATDTLQFSGTIFANAQAALNAAQDDGHGNTVVTLDGHDTITLSGVLKAQLHVSDFHVV